MAETNQAYAKRFEHPDQRVDFAHHGHMDMLSFGEKGTIVHGVFEPGWKWTEDEKPLFGTQTCEMEHTGYVLKGNMVVQLDNGQEFRLQQGDAFHIPAGHTGWVAGDETCELLIVAKDKEEKKKIS